MPFDLFLQSNGNQLVRVTRIGKLYKLVKIFRLLRLVKVIKEQKKFLGRLSIFFKWTRAVEKIVYFLLIFILTCHIIACFWILGAEITNDNEVINTFDQNWITKNFDVEQLTMGHIYTIALYYTVTTITTVGYGDISGTNTFERIICIIIMIVGVFFFSYTSGTLTNMISNQEAHNKNLNDKIIVLNKIYEQYKLPADLYYQTKGTIEHTSNST